MSPPDKADSMLPVRIVLGSNGSEIRHHPPPRNLGKDSPEPDGIVMATAPDRLSLGEHIGRIVGTIVVITIILLYLTGGMRR